MDRNAAIGKLEGMINEGRESMTTAVSEIQSEWEKRRDLIVRPEALDYVIDTQGIKPVIDGEALMTTSHSEAQLLERASIPNRFAQELRKWDQGDLLQHNLRTLMPVMSPNGVLVRRVDDVAKGILSTSYRRMDAGLVFQAFVTAGLKNGFVPHRGLNTDRVYNLSMLDQEVTEPVPNEFIVHGISIRTSDYGSGALEFNLMLMRIACSNLSIGMDMLRKVHLGGRFNAVEGQGPVLELSGRTHLLDTKAVGSAVSDLVGNSRKYVAGLDEHIQKAAETGVDINASVAALKKRGVRKELAEKVKATFETRMPVEALPEGNNAWRLSNVLSLLAQSETGDNQLDLEREAFNVLGKIQA